MCEITIFFWVGGGGGDNQECVQIDLVLPKEEKCGGGALERNLTGRCPFFKNLHNVFRKGKNQ